MVERAFNGSEDMYVGYFIYLFAKLWITLARHNKGDRSDYKRSKQTHGDGKLGIVSDIHLQ
jgi:hypothetical protein